MGEAFGPPPKFFHRGLKKLAPAIIQRWVNSRFKVVRVGKHISMVRENPGGTRTPLTMPNHRRIKGSTLRVICRQAGTKREEFLKAFKEA